ncbi:MAG: hypothetical protein IPJ49_14665 [Candidatus Obscuribacter sp.]|nr:hypothetical protein [Candidatus Obscuribacter sp.]
MIPAIYKEVGDFNEGMTFYTDQNKSEPETRRQLRVLVSQSTTLKAFPFVNNIVHMINQNGFTDASND